MKKIVLMMAIAVFSVNFSSHIIASWPAKAAEYHREGVRNTFGGLAYSGATAILGYFTYKAWKHAMQSWNNWRDKKDETTATTPLLKTLATGIPATLTLPFVASLLYCFSTASYCFKVEKSFL